ncbi:hypothetical protein GUITHDRAFT_114025 [Guillardia theta CCMP2712]|uniref:Ribosomal protein eL8/eL30/eS12/Gadd45 domain-containing protein n=1 Tax=Guillardia theta (strain CCMP2712) TaxID=905079 RepID=L1IUM4_GUITC|nr:hypothetical protein GUITHDRAFT_114025 [Guillardia theta CCMP2712]EKX39777.1 hypothetical protein GUITHDRAFT_114025 [Guillardia theta CCMP2712]|eukprot:XP_005826757.1 hypothetical protein GUITHDRAFT_114025 [Guillardia theta CCMP2712]
MREVSSPSQRSGSVSSITPLRSAKRGKKDRKSLSQSPMQFSAASFKASDTEFAISIPLLNKQDRLLAVQRLQKSFEPLRALLSARASKKRVTRVKERKRKRQSSEMVEDDPQPDDKVTRVRAEELGDFLGSLFCVGLNEVTRALERDKLALVIVCKDSKPSFIVHHLLAAAAVRNTVICSIGETSLSLGELFGYPSALAVGFFKDEFLQEQACERNKEAYDEFMTIVQFLRSRAPSLDMPWMK